MGHTARDLQVLRRMALFTANDEPMEPTMIRTLLTTSAVALVLSTAAIAQTTTDPAAPAAPEPTVGQQVDNALDNAGDALQNAGDAVQDAAQDAGAAVDNAVDNAGQAVDNAVDSTGAAINNAGDAIGDTLRQPWDYASGYTIGTDDVIVNDLLGAPVYSSTSDDAEEIGSVNDLIITADGDINAVVIGVGGFLGIGEKNVAVDFLSLEYNMAADNTWRWVLPTTKEALEAAPEFVWQNPREVNVAPVDGMAVDTMAPADPAAPAVPQ